MSKHVEAGVVVAAILLVGSLLAAMVVELIALLTGVTLSVIIVSGCALAGVIAALVDWRTERRL